MDSKAFLVEFGKLLKKQRKAMSLSQVNAAEQMKIDYRHYQNIEGGKINLRLDTFMKLIEFYKIRSGDSMNVTDLLGFIESPQEESNSDWDLLYQFYVRNNKAGFALLNADYQLVQANPYLYKLAAASKDSEESLIEMIMSTDARIRFARNCEAGFQSRDSKPFKVDLTLRGSASGKRAETFLCVPQFDYGAKGPQAIGRLIFLSEQNLLEDGGRFTNLIQHFRTYFSEVPQLIANPAQMWSTQAPIAYRAQG